MADFQSFGNFPSLKEVFMILVTGPVKEASCFFKNMESNPNMSFDLEFLIEVIIDCTFSRRLAVIHQLVRSVVDHLWDYAQSISQN